MGYIEEIRALVGHRPLILVGAVVVAEDEQGRILLQRRTEPYGRWGLPGGLMELGESTEETARREVYEETGLTVGKLQLIDVFSGKDHFSIAPNGDEYYVVVTAYATREISGVIRPDPKETLECAFLPVEQFPKDIVRTHKRILEQHLAASFHKYHNRNTEDQ